jgi:hypothetical protein
VSPTAVPHPGRPGRMRVLVVATPMAGHLFPLVPLTRALRDAGHQVVVATTGDALRACPRDLTAVDVAPGLRLTPFMLRFALAHPRLARDLGAGRDDPRASGLLWAPVNERMTRGVVDLADRLAPDLVLHEPFAVAAADAATRRGVPSVVVEHSLFDPVPQLAGVAAAYRGAPPSRRPRRSSPRRHPAWWVPGPACRCGSCRPAAATRPRVTWRSRGCVPPWSCRAAPLRSRAAIG